MELKFVFQMLSNSIQVIIYTVFCIFTITHLKRNNQLLDSFMYLTLVLIGVSIFSTLILTVSLAVFDNRYSLAKIIFLSYPN